MCEILVMDGLEMDTCQPMPLMPRPLLMHEYASDIMEQLQVVCFMCQMHKDARGCTYAIIMACPAQLQHTSLDLCCGRNECDMIMAPGLLWDSTA